MKRDTDAQKPSFALASVLLVTLSALVFAAWTIPAQAAPVHPFLEDLSLDGSGTPAGDFDKACGTAADSKGDLYVASAGNSAIDVFGAAHEYLTTIVNANQPCGLAVDTKGNLYVSEAATGNVVRYAPNAYPFTGTPTYGSPVAIDSSGEAKGIGVDPFDSRLYVAKGGRVDTYNSAGVLGENEVQRVAASSETTGGTYRLSFEGDETAPIKFDATHAELQAALESLSTIGAGDVAVTQGQTPSQHLITFTGALGSADVEQLGISKLGLLPHAVKRLTVDATAGTYTLNLEGQTTAPIAYDATAATLQSALEALSNIAPGDISVTGGPGGPGGSSPYSVTFEGAYAGAGTPGLSANQSGLTGTATATDTTFGAGAFVATDTPGFDGRIGEGVLSEATGVAAYTYRNDGAFEKDRYLFVADPSGAAADRVQIFASTDFRSLGLRQTVDGSGAGQLDETPDGGIGFGAAGAYVGVDQGSCPPAGQACTAGHFFVYDAAHNALDEFEANGQYLTQVRHPSFADSGPTAVVVARPSGGGNGVLYVTSGAAAGAEVLAFGPLPALSRKPLTKPKFKANSSCDVAVDAHGNIYVAGGTSIKVYGPEGNEIAVHDAKGNKGIVEPGKPCKLAIDSEGNLYASDVLTDGKAAGKVVVYDPSVYPPTSETVYSEPKTIAVMPSNGVAGIAVDPSDNHLFVTSELVLQEYDSAKNGSELLNGKLAGPGLNRSFSPQSIDVCDRSGDIYVAEKTASRGFVSVLDHDAESKTAKALATIDGSGSPKGPFARNFLDLAVDQSNCHVLVSLVPRGERQIEEYEPSGTFVGEFGDFGEGAEGIAVGPNGDLLAVDFSNLTAFGPLSYGEPPVAVTGLATRVEGDKATLSGTVSPRGFLLESCRFEYVDQGGFEASGFATAAGTPCSESPAAIGEGSNPVAVHADVLGLTAGTRYYFRLSAQNKFGPHSGDPSYFGPPLLSTDAAGPILYTEATLRATVDPSRLNTTYRFEYGASEAYGEETAGFQVPAVSGAKGIQAPIFGLEEGTTYHFRIVVENEAGVVEGPDQTLTTLEQAGPQDGCPNAELRSGRSANLPDCRAYELVTPADTHGENPHTEFVTTSMFENWMVTPRGPAAGNSLVYLLGGPLPGDDGNGLISGYEARRDQGGWTSTLFAPTAAQVGEGGVDQVGVSPDHGYSFWRISGGGTLAGGNYLRAPSGFEPIALGNEGEDLNGVGKLITADAAHVIFTSAAHLEEEAAPAGTEAVYDRTPNGPTRVVSLRPDGGSFAAGEHASFLGASEDGSSVVFEVGGAMYVRRSNAQTAKVADAHNQFAGVSTDGKRVFYADANLSGDGRLGPPSGLFAFDVDSQTTVPVAPDSIFVNVSADGSHVYFTSQERLDEAEEGVPGKDNLYTWDGSATRFVAVLDSVDLTGSPNLTRWAAGNVVGPDSNGQSGMATSPSRTTPDGTILVFQSHADLTGYESEGRWEIYRYDTSDATMLCVSCDPSGAPPSAGAGLQKAPNSAVVATTLIPSVTEDGDAVFFESGDPLLPEDANNAGDVYEWRAQGSGECKRAGGCLHLISTGQGGANAYLYSMTPDGHDVFIHTEERLVGSDTIATPSIYDARVDGGFPETAEEACQGDACQGLATPPPSLPPAASSDFQDRGNEAPRAARCPKGKRRVLHRGKARCVKRKKQGAARHHRRNHGKRRGVAR